MPANTALPPYHHHTSIQIPPSRALSLLSAYLDASSTNAALHPNALLTKGGPKMPMSTGGVLHNLRRIEAGLRGERVVEEEISFDGEETMGERRTLDGGGAGGVWQDREEFEREQEGLGEGSGDGVRGGVRARDGAEEGGEVPRVKGMRRGDEMDGEGESKERDERRKKEKRKNEKKQRRKIERKMGRKMANKLQKEATVEN